MNSKGRVQALFRGEIPDRVPIGEYSIDSDLVERIIGHETYLRAKAKSKEAIWDGRRDEVAESWKADIVELYRKLPVFDIVNLAAECTAFLPPAGVPKTKYKKLDDSTYELECGEVYKYSEPTRDLVLVKRADSESIDLTTFKEEPDLTPPDPSCLEVYDAVLDELRDDFFIVGLSGPEVGLVDLGGTEQTLLQYAMCPELVESVCRRRLAEANFMDAYCKRDGVDAIMWGQDHSYRSGPMISPEMFRQFALPVYQSRVANAKDALGAWLIKHACGNNWKLLDLYVEAGFDSYQSIQASAGMDLAEVKQAYGEKLVLWGGVLLELLLSGTIAEVREASRKAIEAGKPGGRYIFGSTHSIATGTNYDNFMAMLDEHDKHAAY